MQKGRPYNTGGPVIEKGGAMVAVLGQFCEGFPAKSVNLRMVQSLVIVGRYEGMRVRLPGPPLCVIIITHKTGLCQITSTFWRSCRSEGRWD